MAGIAVPPARLPLLVALVPFDDEAAAVSTLPYSVPADTLKEG